MERGATALGPASSAVVPRPVPRVIAVVVARRAESLVAALAGVTAQTVQPDVLIGVDCTPAGTLVLPAATRPAGRGAADHIEREWVDQPYPDQSNPDEPRLDGPGLDGPDVGKESERGEDFEETFGELLQEPGELLDEPGEPDEQPTGEYDVLEENSLHDADGRPVVGQEPTEAISATAATSRDTLAAHCDAVISLPTSTTTTAAVQHAVRWVDDNPEPAGSHTPHDAQQDWIWLLGDSERPSMKALEHLLGATRTSTNLGIVGAKHRAGPTGRELVDVGLTTTRFGRVMSFVEPDEPDQGQRDHVSDTFAVPLSGMLVRRDLWERLRGLDPALDRGALDSGAPYDASVDVCRRAWLSGERVEVVPGAVLTAAASAAAPRVDRRARTHRRLVGAPLAVLPIIALGIVVGALGRLLGGLIAKEPLHAAGLAASSLIPLLRPDQVVRGRWRARTTRTVARRRLEPLLATTRQTWRWHRERLSRSRPRLVSPAGTGSATSTWGLLALLLASAGAAAFARLLRSGPFTSGALPAVPTDAGGLWAAVSSSWVSGGLGDVGPADPLLAVLAALGTPFGSPRLGVLILLLLALPLTGLSAWWAAGGLTRRGGVRFIAGLAWASTPVVLLGLGAGRLSLVLAALCLPAAARCLGQAVAARSRRSVWSWSAAAGLLMVPATAGLTAVAVALALLLVVLAARTRRLGLLLTPVASLTLVLPVLIEAWHRPAVLFGEPGLPQARAAVPGWAALLGWDTPASAAFAGAPEAAAHGLLDGSLGVGTVTTLLAVLPWVLGAVPLSLAVLGLGSLLRATPRGAVCRTGWLLAAGGVLLAHTAQRFVVGVDLAGPVRGSAAPGVLLSVLGLLVAGVSACGPHEGGGRGLGNGLRRVSTTVAATLAFAVTLGTLGLWVATQVAGPPEGDLNAGARPPLPAVVVDAADSPDAVRTVVVSAGTAGQPGLTVSVLRGAGASPQSQSVATTARPGRTADAAERALAQAVARATSGAEDARPLLAPFGVGAVVVLPGTDPESRVAASELAARLDATVGLAASGEVAGVRAWRVNALTDGAGAPDRPAAARLVPADGEGGARWTALPTDGAHLRTSITTKTATLVLAERADAGWQATFDGRQLTPTTVDGWAQGFEVPAGSGELELTHSEPWWRSIGWLQFGVLLLTLVVALPVRARPHHDLPTPARGAAA